MTGREQREANVRACLDALMDAIPKAVMDKMPSTPEHRQVANNTVVEVIMGMTEEGPNSAAFQMVVSKMKERTDSAFTTGYVRGFTYGATTAMEHAMKAAQEDDEEPDA